jgi:hypothetical protein
LPASGRGGGGWQVGAVGTCGSCGPSTSSLRIFRCSRIARRSSGESPAFPHDSTSNQFFDEACFESYRLLGYHTVLSVAAGLKHLPDAEALCEAARKSLADLQAAHIQGSSSAD